MATDKQRLARTRNWLKFRLMGVVIPTEAMTPAELELANAIKVNIKTLIENFNTESTSLGLKVDKRCWCNKIIKKGEIFCCKEHEM